MTKPYPALVLNADLTPLSIFPLSVWGFERVMRQTMRERVYPVATYDAQLRSPSFTWQPPSVVALKRQVKRPQTVAFSRMAIFLRDDFTCQYCLKRLPPKELTFDHVVPRADGGRSTFENICAACVDCNSAKGHRRDMAPVRPPRRPEPHELTRKAPPDIGQLHESWHDFLYWAGVLDSD